MSSFFAAGPGHRVVQVLRRRVLAVVVFTVSSMSMSMSMSMALADSPPGPGASPLEDPPASPEPASPGEPVEMIGVPTLPPAQEGASPQGDAAPPDVTALAPQAAGVQTDLESASPEEEPALPGPTPRDASSTLPMTSTIAALGLGLLGLALFGGYLYTRRSR